MNDKEKSVDPPSLPPRLPQNEERNLSGPFSLGNRKQVELKTDARRQLENLIGIYPTIKEAALWKRVLRRACQKFSTAE